MAPITSAIRRQMTDEGARVTADRDEFLAVCDAVDSIHARKLKALEASTARVDELCRENERLRGLCVKALEWLRWAGGITCPPEVPDEFADSLRELGIEVSDG